MLPIKGSVSFDGVIDPKNGLAQTPPHLPIAGHLSFSSRSFAVFPRFIGSRREVRRRPPFVASRSTVAVHPQWRVVAQAVIDIARRGRAPLHAPAKTCSVVGRGQLAGFSSAVS
jgi:hypothetical protein